MAEIPAKVMQTAAIEAHIDALHTQIDEYFACLEGKSGSPGEWMYERLNELETELQRRKAEPSGIKMNGGGPEFWDKD